MTGAHSDKAFLAIDRGHEFSRSINKLFVSLDLIGSICWSLGHLEGICGIAQRMVCTSEVHRLPDTVSLHRGEHQFAAILWMDQKFICSAFEVINNVVLLGNLNTSMQQFSKS